MIFLSNNEEVNAMDTERRTQDLDMMIHPGEWPLWPILPVKERVGMKQPRLGVMLETERGIEPVIYLSDLFSIGKKPLDETEKIEYQDFEGLLDAGWTVD